MSATNSKIDAEGWTPVNSAANVKPKTNKSWSIDRDRKTTPRHATGGRPADSTRNFSKSGSNNKPYRPNKKIVKEKIPDVVAQMVVTEVLTLVGDSNWNDPANVSKTIANMMSIDLTRPIEGQIPRPVEIDRTVFVPANKGSDVPFWICQSMIRVDEKFGNRFIEYKGAKYNKIDIIFENDYFKAQMDIVAKAANCTWNARWGNSKKEENRLYQKTRSGAQSDESWLDRCVKHLLTDADTDGINITSAFAIA